ncbi:MAG: hypothetical protein M3O70_01695, partial [Actinomycetota bacterium]|nr:hypothetical protein [Actinomycetota bacterium]
MKNADGGSRQGLGDLLEDDRVADEHTYGRIEVTATGRVGGYRAADRLPPLTWSPRGVWLVD